MKKLNLQSSRILKAGLIIVLVAFMSSCEKWIDPELNNDPAAPIDVPMSLLIPAIQLDIGYNNFGNDVVRPTNIWMQMFDGVARQSYTQARYQVTSADVNNLWGSIYTTQLMNAKILMAKAYDEGSPYNAGVGEVLTALVLGMATDLWGDIPYSDALKGEENVLEAQFDTQEQIYDSIFALLDRAIVNLDPANENPIDIEGDVFYEGNHYAWRRAAHSLKARHLLQLSKRNGNQAYVDALAEVASGFRYGGDNLECPFAATNQNPIFQMMEQRSGDLVMCSTLLNEMNATGDPRIAMYYAEDDDGNITGSDPGSENDAASHPGDWIAGQTASTHLMTYAELKFIEAECLLQTGDADGAADAYIEAVTESLHQISGAASDAAWLANNIENEDGTTITLQKIIMQKRHALVGQLQPYNDWRRTGIPALTLASGATLTAVPQRYPYSQDEGIYNPDNVPVIGSLIDPVWWAQE